MLRFFAVVFALTAFLGGGILLRRAAGALLLRLLRPLRSGRPHLRRRLHLLLLMRVACRRGSAALASLLRLLRVPSGGLRSVARSRQALGVDPLRVSVRVGFARHCASATRRYRASGGLVCVASAGARRLRRGRCIGQTSPRRRLRLFLLMLFLELIAGHRARPIALLEPIGLLSLFLLRSLVLRIVFGL